MTFWTFWDRGGNWIIFTLFFLLVEFFAILNHHNTLSETYWSLEDRWPAVGALILWVGVVVLTGHFLADWWRG